MYLIISGKLFQIIAPEYCKEHLKELLLALGKNNLFAQHDLVQRVAISRVSCASKCASEKILV